MNIKVATILLILLANCASAASYYVATGGSDAAAGTSEGAAWQTVAKVNGLTFSAGDTISFNRGDVWDERLTVPSTGTAGSYITFTAYGSGALPVLLATNGRPEAISIPVGKAYIKVNFLHLRGGATNSASALLESDSIENVIEDCTFEGQNLCDSCIAGSSTVRRCWIQGARDDGYTLHGTDIGLVESCVFTNNRSAINNSGTAMSLTVNDCVFEDNGNGSSSFGDVNGLSAGVFTFNRCDFRGRADGAPHGYLVEAAGTTATINYCRFNNSRSISSSYGGVSVNSGGILNLNNCIFIGNVTADRGQIVGNTGILNATNCIFYNVWRVKATEPGELRLKNCIIFNTGGIDVPGEHVYTSNNDGSAADPLFVGASDWHLQAGSPGMNAGVNIGLSLDFAGNAVGNPPEIGVFEYAVPAIAVGNANWMNAGIVLKKPQ